MGAISLDTFSLLCVSPGHNEETAAEAAESGGEKCRIPATFAGGADLPN